MLKRTNTWELESRRIGPLSNNVVRITPRVAPAARVPHFNYELSPKRWDRLGMSLILHALAVLALVSLAVWLPHPRVQKEVLTVTPIYAPVPPKPVQKIVPPPPQVLAKLTPPPKPPVLEAPKPQPSKIELPKPVEVKPPQPVATALPEPIAPKPVMPKHVIVENTFDSGSSAKPTIQKPVQQVQTGGFGDPNGVHGNSDKKAALTVASVGSFDMPTGPGNGNGTRGKSGTPGVVPSAGFGDGTAGAGGHDRGPKGGVTEGGFNNVAATTAGPRRAAEAGPATEPLEITFKPRPVYTEEARKLRVEGEVLLEVMFSASGELHVQRVVKGLGHGLDQAAERAAAQIRFHPAKRNGQPCDSVALVHINFELAE